MSAADLLHRALALIEPKASWGAGAMASDRLGREVKLDHPTACRFCMVGALQKAGGTSDEYGAAIMHLRRACGDRSIFEFNDTHGHKAVKKAMRRAIERAAV